MKENKFLTQLSDFIAGLDNKIKELIPEIEDKRYTGLSLELPEGSLGSWEKALSELESFTASLYMIFNDPGAETKLLLSYIPLLTPRGTFVIEGRERVRLTNLESASLNEVERDLCKYTAKQADIFKYIDGYFGRLLKKIGENKKGFFASPEVFTGGAYALLKSIFNSTIGINKFPFLDSTNPLSEVSHIRKVSFWVGEHSKKGRDIHPSHYGRLCVVETPESEKIGARLHLAHKANIDPATGKILTPLTDIGTDTTNEVMPDNELFIADQETTLNGKIVIRGGEDGIYKDASEVKYKDAFKDQLFGFAALQLPFIQHNDPARAVMGAKNLKQAVPVKEPEIPLILTGYEKETAEDSGRIIKAEEDGEVVNVSKDHIIVKNNAGGEKTYYLIYDVPSVGSKSAVYQLPTVNAGDTVKKDQIIAEGAGIKDGCLALGANFLVAYMPYFGYNMDDGIVVSRRVAEKLTSIHIDEFEIKIETGDILKWSAPEGLRLSRNTPIAILKRKKEEITHLAKGNMVGGVIRKVIIEPDVIRIWVKQERRLEVGDKLMGRHGNKGIVSKILPVNEMPYFDVDNEGNIERRYIDVIMNPHSVITRMNIGQIYETHFGWIAKEHPDEEVRNIARSSGSSFNKIELDKLSNMLEESGFDNKGCVKLRFKKDEEDFITIRPVVVGYQYIVKLNHLAINKLSSRGERGAVSFITGMPLAGRKRGGGQRVGEMEVWALLAHGADEIAREFLGEKANAHILDTGATSITESLKTFIYFLRGLGICLDFMDKVNKVIDAEDFEKRKITEIKQYRISWANDSMMTAWGRYLYTPKKDSFEKLKDFWARKENDTEIRKGAKEIINLTDFEPEYKDEMRYISLVTPVKLCEREVRIIPVIPVRCRPHSANKIKKLYQRIYLKNKEIECLDTSDKKYDLYVKKLQSIVIKLEKELKHYINGRQGIIRKAILGKRINLSARAVIIPNPDIDADEVEIPWKIMNDLDIKEGDKVLLNRQPSLHIHNIQAFRAKKSQSNAIAINPLVCSGFNADFDGDTMAVYKTGKDIPDNMMVSGQLVLAANGLLNLNLSQDIASGIYIAMADEEGRKVFNSFEIGDPIKKDSSDFSVDEFKGDLTIGKLCQVITDDNYNIQFVQMTNTIEWLNEILTITNLYEQITSKKGGNNLSKRLEISKSVYDISRNEENLKRLNRSLLEEFHPQETPKSLTRVIKELLSNIVHKNYLNNNDQIKTLKLAKEIEGFGLKWATISGLTFSIFDLKELQVSVDEKKVSLIDDSSIGTILKYRVENPISIMVQSGGRGENKQVRQMMATKGIIARMGGKKTSVPVESCYLKGLSPTEYYLACYGARNSLGDKKLLTPECGYLTRRLVFAASDIIIFEEDCNTKDGFDLEPENVLGRTTLEEIPINTDGIIPQNTIINEEIMEKIKKAAISKIKVRSPLTCKSPNGVCKKCYGWDLSMRSEPRDNFKVGIIAAQVIGERATQDAMRTYHVGEATGTVKLFDKVKSIFDNSNDPDTGKKVSEEINDIDGLFKLAKDLYGYYDRKVDLKHYEVIVRALTNNGEYIGAKKINDYRSVLHSASFEKALTVIKESASTGDVYPIKSIFEKLFI